MGKGSRASSGPTATGPIRAARGREIGGIVLLALALFLALSVESFQFGTGSLMGPGGALVATGVYALVGVVSYLAALAIGATAVHLLRGHPVRLRSLESAAIAGGTLF